MRLYFVGLSRYALAFIGIFNELMCLRKVPTYLYCVVRVAILKQFVEIVIEVFVARELGVYSCLKLAFVIVSLKSLALCCSCFLLWSTHQTQHNCYFRAYMILNRNVCPRMVATYRKVCRRPFCVVKLFHLLSWHRKASYRSRLFNTSQKRRSRARTVDSFQQISLHDS